MQSFKEWAAFQGRIQKSEVAVIKRGRVTARCHSSVTVNAMSSRQPQILLKVVDVGARELGCDVPNGTPEDRIHKVLLLEEGALVVGALASVVEWEDARVFFAEQVCSLVLPADRIVRMGGVEGSRWPCALIAALVIVRLVGKSILLRNPGKEA